jgi:hypothetical protein
MWHRRRCHTHGGHLSAPPPSLFPAILPCRLDKRSLRSENLHHLRLLLHIYISVRTYYACVPHRWCLSPGNFILHCDTSHPDFCVILMYLQRLSSMNWNDFCEWLQEMVYKVLFCTLNVVQNMRKMTSKVIRFEDKLLNKYDSFLCYSASETSVYFNSDYTALCAARLSSSHSP